MKKVLALLLVIICTVAIFAEPEWLVDKDAKGGKFGGTLYLTSFGTGPKTFNPAWAQETSSTDIIGWFLDSLMGQDERGVINQPQMAKAFTKKETASGGTEYTFTLRKGMVWSDGKPITLDDVIYTFKDVNFVSDLSANGNEAYLDDKGNLPETIKVDDWTVKFVYKSKFRRGYEAIGTTQIMPKHIFEKAKTSEAMAKIWTVEQVDKLVGSGPFLVDEYKQGVRVVLKKNPNYYVKSADGKELPYLDKAIYTIVTDTNVERLKFEAGESDMFGPTAEVFPALKAQAAAKKWTAVAGNANFGSSFVIFNYLTADKTKRELFRNVNFRLAIGSSINRDAIIDNVYNGLGVSIYGPVSPSSSYFNKATEAWGKANLKYSLAKSKEYLVKAGVEFKNNKAYFKGKPVTYDLTTNAGNKAREEIANILVDAMKKLGIEVNYRPINFNTMLSNMDAGNFDAAILGLTGSNDPGSGTNVWRLEGGLHFWNPSANNEGFEWVKTRDRQIDTWEKRIDEIFVEQVGLVDEAKLKAAFDEFQMLAAKNQPMVYTITQKFLLVYKSSLHLATDMPNPATGSGINPGLWHSWAIWKE